MKVFVDVRVSYPEKAPRIAIRLDPSEVVALREHGQHNTRILFRGGGDAIIPGGLEDVSLVLGLKSA